mmetsp:Transcript_73637/g.227399  ORF Transcript_73637/g.227399 Transcript_73637/m.227399 type:complete len:651 (-) Transcript_73637:20-1972(-)
MVERLTRGVSALQPLSVPGTPEHVVEEEHPVDVELPLQVPATGATEDAHSLGGVSACAESTMEPQQQAPFVDAAPHGELGAVVLPGHCPEVHHPSSLTPSKSWESPKAWAFSEGTLGERRDKLQVQRTSSTVHSPQEELKRTTTVASSRSKPRPSWKSHRTLQLSEVRGVVLGDDASHDSDEEFFHEQPYRAKVDRLLNHRYFQLALSCVILLNAVYVGIETDHGNPWARNGVDGVEVVFLLIFLTEISLRLFVGLQRFFCGPLWETCWNLFDLGLVLIACLDLLIISLFFQGAAEDLEGFSVLRILRVLRVARVLRLLQIFSELWLLVAGVLDAMRSLVWAWILILIIVYVFGVLITGAVGKPHAQDTCSIMPEQPVGALFGSVYKSMFTLFSVMTINGWGDIAKCAMEVQGWTWILFVTFLLCTSFGMLNVIIAVIVEGTLDRAMQQHRLKSQKEDSDRRHLIVNVVGLFKKSDTDNDGQVTREEFLSALEQPGCMRMLMGIGIDVAKARNLFDILDYDCSGSLDLTEFIQGMLRARGAATSKDLISLQCDVMRAEQRYREELLEVKDRFVRRLEPVERDIEAAHLEVRRLIRALEADPHAAGPEECNGNSEDTLVLSCSSTDCLEPSPHRAARVNSHAGQARLHPTG